MKAAPVLVVAGVFDALRFIFEQFWFFGPALAATYCTVAGADTTVGAAAGTKVVAAGCTAVSGVVGYFGAPAIAAFGVVMAIAIGLFGWMTVGLMLMMTNARIFKEHSGHTLWFVASLAISEIPIIGSVPALAGTMVKMYSAQIKKDKENVKKYEKEIAAAQQQEQNQQRAELMQAQAAQMGEESSLPAIDAVS